MWSEGTQSFTFIWVFLDWMILVVLFIVCLIFVRMFYLFIVIDFAIIFFIFSLFIGYLLFSVIKSVFKWLLIAKLIDYCSCFDLILININFIIDPFYSFVHLWVSFIIILYRYLTFTFTVMINVYSLCEFSSLLFWLLLEKTWLRVCIYWITILLLLSFEIINVIDDILLRFKILYRFFRWSFFRF